MTDKCKSLLTGALAVSMTFSTMSVFPINGLAAEIQDDIISIATDSTTSSEEKSDIIANLATENAKRVMTLVSELYGLGEETTLSKTNIERFAKIIYLDAAELEDLENGLINDIKTEFNNLTEAEKVDIALNCPVRLAAYASIDGTLDAVKKASDVARLIYSVYGDHDVTLTTDNYAEYDTALKAANAAYAPYSVESTEETILKVKKYLETPTNYVAQLDKINNDFENCKSIQREDFLAKVGAIGTYESAVADGKYNEAEGNFMKKSALVKAAKASWKSIVLVDLQNELMEGDIYKIYENIVLGSGEEEAIERKYITELTDKTSGFFSYISEFDKRNDLEKLAERENAITFLEKFKTDYEASVYSLEDGFYVDEIISTISSYRELHTVETAVKAYIDAANAAITANTISEEYYTQEQISAGYATLTELHNTALGLVGEDGKYISLELKSDDNVATVNMLDADIEELIAKMDESARAAHLAPVLNEIGAIEARTDVYSKEYIDAVVAANKSVNDIVPTVQSMVLEYYTDAVNRITAINTNLYSTVNAKSVDLSNNYLAAAGILDESGLAWNTYGAVADAGDSIEDAKDILGAVQGTVSDMQSDLDVLNYYNEKIAVPNGDTETTAAITNTNANKATVDFAGSEYDNHISAIEDLRGKARAVNDAYAECAITLLPDDDNNFETVYEFIKANFEGDNDIFADTYDVFATAMNTYRTTCEAYALAYPDEAFANDDTTDVYVAKEVYDNYNATAAYIGEYIGVASEENKQAVAEYVEKVNSYLEYFTAMQNEDGNISPDAANAAYDTGYVELLQIAADYAEHKATEGDYQACLIAEYPELASMYGCVESEIENWNIAKAFYDKVKSIDAVYEDRAVLPEYETRDPKYVDPMIGETKMSDVIYQTIKIYENEWNMYYATHAYDELLIYKAGYEEDCATIGNLKAEIEFVIEWENNVTNLPTITDIKDLSDDTWNEIQDRIGDMAVIKESETMSRYAYKADSIESTDYFKNYEDLLLKKEKEYIKTVTAYEINELISGISLDSTESKLAGRWEFEQAKLMFEDLISSEGYDKSDEYDIVFRMPLFGKYTELESFYYAYDINTYKNAVIAVDTATAATTDFTAIKDALVEADIAYESLTDKQKTECEEAYVNHNAKLDAYNLWIGVSYSVSEKLTTESGFAIDVFEDEVQLYFDSEDKSGEGYKQLEKMYSDTMAMLNAIVDENEAAYVTAHGYAARMNVAKARLDEQYLYVSVENKIDALYEKFTSGEAIAFESYASDIVVARTGLEAVKDMSKIRNYAKYYIVVNEYNSNVDVPALAALINAMETPNFNTYKDVAADIAEYSLYIDSLSDDNKSKLSEQLDDSNKLNSLAEICNLYETKGGKPGDINDDGKLNVLDIVPMITVLLSDTPDFEDLGAHLRADCNWDNTFDDNDILWAIANIEFE